VPHINSNHCDNSSRVTSLVGDLATMFVDALAGLQSSFKGFSVRGSDRDAARGGPFACEPLGYFQAKD